MAELSMEPLPSELVQGFSHSPGRKASLCPYYAGGRQGPE